MSDAGLVDRLAGLPRLADIPRTELEWLVARGELDTQEAGTVLGAKGRRIERMWIVISGCVAVRVDRGAGPRLVTEWHVGEVCGMLPFSRMKGPPGDNYLEERTEFLALEERHFPALIRDCPVFTAYTVHTMLDRARNFNTSALQDEKMVSLGKLAAGLAHELNNPASATVRGAKLLRSGLADAAAAARALRASRCGDETLDVIERVWQATLAAPVGPDLDPLQRADREDMISEWLDRHGLDEVDADSLVDTAVTVEALDTVAAVASDTALEAAVRWIAAECTTHALADAIERSAARIHDLVGAVKQFTYMDNLAGPESVAVEPGLRDTVRILTAKIRAKSANVSVDVPPDLPPAYATGGELNQVWMNLLDNALDAIGEGGRVDVTARAELDRVVVRVIDDGPGIPAEMISNVFDPFFTTKPPGQGTGLGLDIAQRLVRRYHGDVMVESQPGRTVFTVTLGIGASAPSSEATV